MMNTLRFQPILFISALLCALIVACNDPTTVGAGIVDTDVVPIKTIELDVDLTQELGSPFTTYAAGGVLETNEAQCGILEDLTFGSTEAAFYMQFIPTSSFVNNNPNRVVDNVEFVLYLDSTATYGTPGALQLSIDRLDEVIDGDQNYLSNTTLKTGDNVISDFSFVPDYSDPADDVELGPYVKIPLPNSIGEEVFSLDSSILNDDALFIENFNGFYVRPTGGSSQLVGFKPYFFDQSVLSGIRIMYRESATDTVNKVYNLGAGFSSSMLTSVLAPTVNTYKHDYTGSLVEAALASPTSDSLYYIQGQGGVVVDISVEGIRDISQVGVNKAEIFIPFQGDDILYVNNPPIRTLFMTREELDGNRNFIPEFFESTIFQLRPMARIDTVGGLPGYYYNIPIQVGQMIDGTIISDIIRLQNVVPSSESSRRNAFGPRNMAEATARSIIFGGKNLSEAIRLKITYTDE